MGLHHSDFPELLVRLVVFLSIYALFMPWYVFFISFRFSQYGVYHLHGFFCNLNCISLCVLLSCHILFVPSNLFELVNKETRQYVLVFACFYRNLIRPSDLHPWAAHGCCTKHTMSTWKKSFGMGRSWSKQTWIEFALWIKKGRQQLARDAPNGAQKAQARARVRARARSGHRKLLRHRTGGGHQNYLDQLCRDCRFRWHWYEEEGQYICVHCVY